MTVRTHRWAKKLLLVVAALPLLQATCDPFALNTLIAQEMAFSIFGSLVGASQQFIATHFPSADIIQTLLGQNRSPFFTF
jgi:uncharacterized membrane protein YjdF